MPNTCKKTFHTHCWLAMCKEKFTKDENDDGDEKQKKQHTYSNTIDGDKYSAR